MRFLSQWHHWRQEKATNFPASDIISHRNFFFHSGRNKQIIGLQGQIGGIENWSSDPSRSANLYLTDNMCSWELLLAGINTCLRILHQNPNLSTSLVKIHLTPKNGFYVLNIYKTHHETMQKRAEGTQQENTEVIISARKMPHKPLNYMTETCTLRLTLSFR